MPKGAHVNLALINTRVWAEIAIVALLAFGAWWAYNAVYERGAESVQVKWDAEKRDQAEQSAAVASGALATTKALSDSLDKQRSTANAQITSLNNSLAAAVAGLSNRAARPSESGLPRDPAAESERCTGRELFREDSAFLTREAARADRLAVQLAQCKAAYDTARAAVN